LFASIDVRLIKDELPRCFCPVVESYRPEVDRVIAGLLD
jgi:hypothetical protein